MYQNYSENNPELEAERIEEENRDRKRYNEEVACRSAEHPQVLHQNH